MTHRQDVFFSSGKGKQKADCAAWLYTPKLKSRKKPPVIIMAHGLSATRDMRLPAFAEQFCEAGYACLVFDYRHFGTSGGMPRQLLDIDRQLTDWHAAIKFARSLKKQLNTKSVSLWGTSFGGGHVISVAASDKKIKAVISQCPFTSGIASSRTLKTTTLARVSALAVADKAGSLLGRKPLTLKASGKPGEAALMDAPDAQGALLKLVGEGSPWKNEVIARFGLQIAGYSPGKKAKKLRMPALFCVCSNDTVAPSKPTLKYVKKAKKGEVKIYDYGHFDIYTDEGFEAVSADQLEFLSKHVPVK